MIFDPLLTPANLVVAFIAINFCTFAAFGVDKMKAEAGKWRIAESTLLMLAFLGGSPGAYAGRSLFRHKTRKQPFSNMLHCIAALQGLFIAGGGGWFLAG